MLALLPATGNVGCCRSDIRILGPVTQVMIHEDDGQHRLRNGRRPQANAGVMAPGGDHLYRVSGDVDRVARHLDARCRLERRMRDDVLSGRDSSEYSPGVVALEARGCQLVAM